MWTWNNHTLCTAVRDEVSGRGKGRLRWIGWNSFNFNGLAPMQKRHHFYTVGMKEVTTILKTLNFMFSGVRKDRQSSRDREEREN